VSGLNNKILIFIVVLVVGGGGFFAGIQYQKSKAPSSTGMKEQNISSNHQSGFREGMSQGMPVAGEVIAKDEESITVKIQDGGSKIVFVSEETLVRKAEEGSMEDISEGIQVIVFGRENDDGSITANNIQLNSGAGERFNRLHQAD
jgi:hypothetical protein